MAKLWNEMRVLAANRTGVPAVNDYEDVEQPEMKKGSWVVILLVVVAFAMVLQMEADNAKTAQKKAYVIRV